ncbi:hypothetical protein HDV06_003546 [Boothiomyces sp. JEL0866]|nr:hypothetical protein HDV06_003546 [Boothiomyces sp. JEL0866]
MLGLKDDEVQRLHSAWYGENRQNLLAAKFKNFDTEIIPQFFRYIQENIPHVEKFELIMASTDLRTPADSFKAREMKRKIIMHVGPTNSGKTYSALQKFYKSDSGVYCGPLRLLAHEIYDKSNTLGYPCNLVTGEEKRESDGVSKWSSTDRVFDIAVIDEIQMIGNNERGWAWTRALLGVRAREVHLCGEESAVPLIERILEETGETMEINTYERLTSLSIQNKAIRSLKNIEKGDCIVTFSRKNIFSLKGAIEKNNTVAVIYGGLPPETRADQARLFNSGEYNVLVASDAIGMGLNLNIKRVIFESLEKFNGIKSVPLEVSQVKQIAGRAGRFKTQYENGLVTTLEQQDLKKLQHYMKSEIPSITKAGLLPEIDQIERFNQSLPGLKMSDLLTRFQELATLDQNYFFCNLKDLCRLADALEGIPLTLKDRYTFIQSPCGKHEQLVDCFSDFASKHANNTVAYIKDYIQFQNTGNLGTLETLHKIIILYLWLGQRFPETFVDLDESLVLKVKIENRINEKLQSMSSRRRKRMFEEEHAEQMIKQQERLAKSLAGDSGIRVSEAEKPKVETNNGSSARKERVRRY